MSFSSIRRIALWVTVIAPLPGCMPQDFRGAVAWKIHESRATDAKSMPVEGMPFLRVDDFLLDRLSAASSLNDAQAAERIPGFIESSHALAVDSAQLELGRLDGADLAQIWRHCFPSEPIPHDLASEIRTRYIKSIDDAYADYARSAISSPDNARKQAALIVASARPSIKDHHGRGLFLELVRASHPPRPITRRVPGAGLTLYEPCETAADPVKSAFDDSAARALLEQFAPTIAQEHPTRAGYSETCDRIGSVQLSGRRDHVEVSIRTVTPALYAYTRVGMIHDRPHIQLVYCYWFPEHPPAKAGDPEAGPIDGATLRITLDSQSRPAIIEAVQNCGCHFRCFAARSLDQAARAEFGGQSDKALSSLTRAGSAVEIINDDLFDLPQSPQKGPIVFSPATAHVPVAVSFTHSDLNQQRVVDRKRYQLHAYEILESMPTDFGRASMFGADGLVHQAGRPEGWLMAATGMLSAGQPRQRGTQLICWDKQSFDDPRLLEKSLRLPSNF